MTFVLLAKRARESNLGMDMADVAGLAEAAGSRFSQLELIGRGSFGDVYKG